MLPHKTARGKAAINRLRVCEGVPTEYNDMKRMVVPAALRVLRHSPGRKFTVLGTLAKEVGWKHHDTVVAFEEKRREEGKVYYKEKLSAAAVVESTKEVDPALVAELATY
eukprot:Pgem_evm1s7179